MFKINLATKDGKTFKLEVEAKALEEKSLHEKVSGKEVSPDLEGYEFEITGTSDKSGFPSHKKIEGVGLGKLLLSYEKGMKKRPKREGKWKRSEKKPKGLRLRKTVRGKVISQEIVQINLKVLKEGNKKLSEIFPEQNKSAEPEQKPKEEAQSAAPKEDETQNKVGTSQEPKPKEEATETTSKPTNNQQQKTSDESLTDKDNSEPQGRANEKKE